MMSYKKQTPLSKALLLISWQINASGIVPFFYSHRRNLGVSGVHLCLVRKRKHLVYDAPDQRLPVTAGILPVPDLFRRNTRRNPWCDRVCG